MINTSMFHLRAFFDFLSIQPFLFISLLTFVSHCFHMKYFTLKSLLNASKISIFFWVKLADFKEFAFSPLLWKFTRKTSCLGNPRIEPTDGRLQCNRTFENQMVYGWFMLIFRHTNIFIFSGPEENLIKNNKN